MFGDRESYRNCERYRRCVFKIALHSMSAARFRVVEVISFFVFDIHTSVEYLSDFEAK